MISNKLTKDKVTKKGSVSLKPIEYSKLPVIRPLNKGHPKMKLNTQLPKGTSNINFSRINKQIYLSLIIEFSELKDLFNLMLTSKAWNFSIQTNNYSWYVRFLKLSGTKITEYEDHIKYKEKLCSIIKALTTEIDNKNRAKFKKTIDRFKYDLLNNPYFYSTHIFSKFKISYEVLLNGERLKVKLIKSSSGEDSSHINLLADISCLNISLQQIRDLVVLSTDSQLRIKKAIVHQVSFDNSLKQLIRYDSISKVNNIYYYCRILLITFKEFSMRNEKVYLLSISIPKCVVCDVFNNQKLKLQALHCLNHGQVKFQSQISQYENSLLLLFRSYTQTFFNVCIRKVDFKVLEHLGKIKYYFKYNSDYIIQNKPYFEMSSFGIIDKVSNMFLVDITLLNDHGTHIVCSTSPVILEEVKQNSNFEFQEFIHFKAQAVFSNVKLTLFFAEAKQELNEFKLTFLELEIE